MRHSGAVKIALGLVTHEGSRFNKEGTAEAQIASIAKALTDAGHDVELLISDRDDFDPARYSLGLANRIVTAWSQAALESRWSAHVGRLQPKSSSRLGLLELIHHLGSGLRRSLSAAGIPGFGRDLGRISLARLINIDLSHLRLLQAAHDWGAEVALILEDDARLAEPDSQTTLVDLLAALPTDGPVLSVLSRSISATELKVRNVLDRSEPFDPHYPELRLLPVPITNTVCASTYSQELITDLLATITPKSLTPVHPIDWRLNRYLLDNPKVTCVWSEPAPFVQMSMH